MTSGAGPAGGIGGGACRRYERSTPFDIRTATEVVPGGVVTLGATRAAEGGTD
jgi:hypothetical protein